MRAPITACVLLAAAVAACSDPVFKEPTTELIPHSLTRDDGDQQRAAAGQALAEPVVVRISDISGRGVPGVPVTFFVSQGGGWVTETSVLTDAHGRAATNWYVGPKPEVDQILVAQSPVGGTGFRAYARELEPGTTYRGAHGYIELIMGDLPLILSAGRGGSLQPENMPNRTIGTPTPEAGTEELIREMVDAYRRRGGAIPTAVISRLHRAKMDPDAEQLEGTQGHAAAKRAWREYHGFLAAARLYAEERFQTGLYVDVHGRDQDPQRVEFGYLLPSAQLALSDTELSNTTILQQSSIRRIAVENNRTDFASIVRGAQSLGALFHASGIPSSPSPLHPVPQNASYVPGGFSTARYGSRNGTLVSAVYMQTPLQGMRDTSANRRTFADTFVDLMDGYFGTFFGAPLTTGQWQQP
jgi:hypothetical protein